MSTPAPGHLLIASAQAGSTDDEALEAACAVLGAELSLCEAPDDMDAAFDRLDGRTPRRRRRRRQPAPRRDPAAGPARAGVDADRAGAARHRQRPGPRARHPARPVRRGASSSATGRPRPLDLLVDDVGGIVVNAVHVGIGADAAEHAGRLKPRLGPLAYPIGAVTAGLRSTGWRLRVEVDGRVVADDHRRSLMVGIGNGRGIGGGTPLLPDALVDDGLLDVMVSQATGPFARVRYGAALTRGEHLQDPDVRFARGRSVTVVGEPVGVNADGETGDEVRRRTWSVEPRPGR